VIRIGRMPHAQEKPERDDGEEIHHVGRIVSHLAGGCRTAPQWAASAFTIAAFASGAMMA
jgi:hypothetical protein